MRLRAFARKRTAGSVDSRISVQAHACMVGFVRISAASPVHPTANKHATWLLTELDPEDGDTAFGLCDLGLGMPEEGTVRLSELASIVGPLKLPVERDLYFVATRTLSEYTRLAQRNGSIID